MCVWIYILLLRVKCHLQGARYRCYLVNTICIWLSRTKWKKDCGYSNLFNNVSVDILIFYLHQFPLFVFWNGIHFTVLYSHVSKTPNLRSIVISVLCVPGIRAFQIKMLPVALDTMKTYRFISIVNDRNVLPFITDNYFIFVKFVVQSWFTNILFTYF